MLLCDYSSSNPTVCCSNGPPLWGPEKSQITESLVCFALEFKTVQKAMENK